MLSERYYENKREAGCDEAGRGCLAGPVFAGAVILPPDVCTRCPELAAGLNDSKQLSEKRRYQLRGLIERDAEAWAVAMVDNTEIDRINILRASILAMHRALDALAVTPQAVIVDGNRFTPWRDVPWQTFVKGDGRFGNIAAASVLAKTHRDEYMPRAHERYPGYGWDVNKGYPTAAHRQAIAELGVTPEHRRTFRLLPHPTLF